MIWFERFWNWSDLIWFDLSGFWKCSDLIWFDLSEIANSAQITSNHVNWRHHLKTFISRDICIQIWRKWHRSKAESQGFRSVPFSSNLDTYISRYGRFEFGSSIDRSRRDRSKNEEIVQNGHQEIEIWPILVFRTNNQWFWVIWAVSLKSNRDLIWFDLSGF